MGEWLFGRDDELAAVDRFLAEAESPAAALLLEGQPGIGKSALWRETLQRAAHWTPRLLVAKPVESETKLSFASLADLLESVIDDVLPLLPDPQRRALSVALLLEDPGSRVDPRGPSTALLNIVRTLAAESPVVIAVDDVQWLDAATAGALAFVVRRLGDAPVRLVLTRRCLNGGSPPLGLERALPADRLRRIVLGPLSLGAIHSLIHARLGVALARPTLLRVHEVAAGNAFFALELARALGRYGFRHEPGGQLPVPQTLRGLIGVRLAELPRSAREVLLVAATLAEPAPGIIASSLRRDVVADLDQAVEKGIIEIGDSGHIIFAHPLLASVVSEDASPTERRGVHLRVANVVTSLEERARHLAVAADGPDPQVASLLDDAARRALLRGAPEAAAELSAQAQRLTPLGREDDVRARGIDAARLFLRAGDTARARELLEQLLPSCPAGEARAAALHLLGLALARGESHSAAEEAFELALAEACGATLRAGIAVSLAVSLMQSGDIQRAAPHAQTAAALVYDVPDASTAAMALSSLAYVEFLLGRGVRRDLIDRAMRLCEQAPPFGSDVAPGNSPPEMGIATVLKWADEFDTARNLLLSLRRRAIEHHDDGWLPPVLFQLAELECWRGDSGAAGRLAQEVHEAALRAGSDSFATLSFYIEALIAWNRGDADHARDRALQGLHEATATANLRQAIRCQALLGGLELSWGDPSTALDHLEHASDLAHQNGYADPGVFRFEGDRIEALIVLGRLEDADALVEPFAKQALVLDRPWALATAARCRALIRASRGDPERALELLDEALSQHDRVPMPIERARTLLTKGIVLRRAKRRAEARRVLEEAVAAFVALEAAGWVGRAREELARISGRAGARNDLTPAELRIANLVADGFSNKEIAGTLFVTPKTIETQLSRIYMKLGIHSRVELARRVLGGRQATRS